MSDTTLALSLGRDFVARLDRAETYLDECVRDLQNVDIATMRAILRGTERSDAQS